MYTIEVTATDGRRLSAETRYPKGHRENPLTDKEAEAKFRSLAEGALGPDRCDQVLSEIQNLERAPTLDALFESLAMPGTV